jgi:hypothetical protein
LCKTHLRSSLNPFGIQAGCFASRGNMFLTVDCVKTIVMMPKPDKFQRLTSTKQLAALSNEGCA